MGLSGMALSGRITPIARNKLMRVRVYLQGLIVLLVLITFAVSARIRRVMVNLDKIYTRGGDRANILAGGKRVPKHDLRVETYGTVDEANSFIGLARLAVAAIPTKCSDAYKTICLIWARTLHDLRGIRRSRRTKRLNRPIAGRSA